MWFIVTVNTQIPFKLIFFTALNFIQNIIIISISHNNWMSLYCFFAWFLLQRLLGMSCTYLIMITTRLGWSIVSVGTITLCCSGCGFQYQLVFSFMDQRYCDLTTNSSEEINCPSIVVFSVACMPLRWIEWHRIHFICCQIC